MRQPPDIPFRSNLLPQGVVVLAYALTCPSIKHELAGGSRQRRQGTDELEALVQRLSTRESA